MSTSSPTRLSVLCVVIGFFAVDAAIAYGLVHGLDWRYTDLLGVVPTPMDARDSFVAYFLFGLAPCFIVFLVAAAFISEKRRRGNNEI